MLLSRRGFLPLLAAPFVVKAASLMPVSSAKLAGPPKTFLTYSAIGNREDLAAAVFKGYERMVELMTNDPVKYFALMARAEGNPYKEAELALLS